MKKNLQQRDSSLDIVRIFAAFSVISVHFFLNNEFYSMTIVGKRMYLMCLIRTFFMSCVPMFLLLSGFLMSKKTLSKNYYLGIGKTLNIYVLASLAIVLFRILQGEDFSIKRTILGLLDFTNAPYSWYIEMYIGLFFLIPFLNVSYHNLKNKKQKQWLIATMIFLTTLPSITNIFNLGESGWWKTLILSNGSQKILPTAWVGIYPITYYFLGCYLSEYRIMLKKRFTFLLLVGNVFLAGSFNYLRSYNTSFVSGIWQEWGAVANMVTTILIFLLITNINTLQWDTRIKGVVKYLSSLSLGTYLVSWIFDHSFYPILNGRIQDGFKRIDYFLPMVICVFLCATILSAVINLINDAIMILVKKVRNRKSKFFCK